MPEILKACINWFKGSNNINLERLTRWGDLIGINQHLDESDQNFLKRVIEKYNIIKPRFYKEEYIERVDVDGQGWTFVRIWIFYYTDGTNEQLSMREKFKK